MPLTEARNPIAGSATQAPGLVAKVPGLAKGQEYTVYGVSQIHKNTLSEPEKYPLNYTAIYDETATFLNILVRKQRILNDAL